MKFTHLHVHTQYSLLDGAASIQDLYSKALADGMPAITISDHGNMFGVFQFVKEAYNHKNADGSLKVKPIVGCEFYITKDRRVKKFSRTVRDPRRHQILLAKNATGYKNLSKLTSLGYIEGMYSKYPRIDKELLEQYHEGLIATTCCIGATIPQLILREGEEVAEKEFKWWLDMFGEDYYIEIQRHGLEEQERVNSVLLKFAKKYNVKIIATNDSHYVNKEDANAHDILLCINTGSIQTDKKITGIDNEVSDKETRFAFPNDEFYFKTTQEMSQTFHDLPQAIDNTNEVIGKIDTLDLTRDILLPHFEVPAEFASQDEYLKHLTWEGARKRYSEITPDVEERINFELFTIKTMGFAGYFLIVSDYISAGRRLGVFIGPGRGSAAGSIVAYCLGISNIDPIKYNLLFERFLNPERNSMPDIDTDFDDDGRQKVMDYVVEKYGWNRVAQVITYGTMAAKSSIKDVARVLDLPLPESNALSKLVPDKIGTSLKVVLHNPMTGTDRPDKQKTIEELGYTAEDVVKINALRGIYKGDDKKARVLHEAEVLEGSVRNTGVHASAVIIAPADLMTIMPVAVSKESPYLLTQIDGGNIEKAGVIKMDFLGLRTLSILKTALKLIKQNHGVEINLDTLPLDDQATFGIFQRGETNGLFQFESPGMQKNLKELKPDKFDDLIAMNALYRPGPMQYIPSYIARKQGREEVKYDLPEVEEYLKDTYGITVYQEQVMLLSQKLAGFTKSQADDLRKAMGKKKKKIIDKMKVDFMEGGKAKGFPEKILDKIYTDWEAFARYAFNKSHSTCYAYLAYQTAYLKIHYTPEFMAALLNHAQNVEKTSFIMEECKTLGVQVLGPDINESNDGYSVNKKGEIRIGFSGVKGVGSNAIASIIEEREKNGPFESVFDLVKRVDHRSVNKRSLENLIVAGGLDCFEGMHRSSFFYTMPGDKMNTLERILNFGTQYQEQLMTNSVTLFGAFNIDTIVPPTVPECDPWPLVMRLEKEREVIGLFLSGHPMDNYKFELEHYNIVNIAQAVEYGDKLALEGGTSPSFRVAGMVIESADRVTRDGRKHFGIYTIQDTSGNLNFSLWEEQYQRLKPLLALGNTVCIEGAYEKRFPTSPYRFEIKSASMLESLMKDHSKAVEVHIMADHLTMDDVDFLVKNFEDYPGKTGFKMKIVQHGEDDMVCLSNNQRGITMNEELVRYLTQKTDIEFSVEVN